MFVDNLPRWERWIYWIIALSGIAYSIYSLFLEGEKYKSNIKQGSLYPGWSWIGRDKDQSDNEWWIWLGMFLNMILLNGIHVLLSQLCFCFEVSAKLHSCVLLLFDLVAVYIYSGMRVLVLHLCLALIMYAVSFSGKIYLVWLMAVAMMSSLNIAVVYEFQISYLKLVKFRELFKFQTTSAFLYTRLTSFAIDKIKYRQWVSSLTTNKHLYDTEMEKFKQYYCDHKNKGKNASNNSEHENICGEHYDKSNACNSKVNQIIDSDPSVIDLLFYAFYLPTVLDGPIFIYKDFHNQVKNSFSSPYFYPDIYDIAKKLIRLSFWALFTEFQFHFLYYSAFSLHPRIISALSPWTLAGIAYCQGQFFMIKYLVMYGTSIQLSRFDGIIPIAAPRCIGWVFLFKDLWKYFDVGLYKFLKNYIYIPLGGSEEGWLRKIFAASVSFMFIFYWHGAGEEKLLWSTSNYLVSILEALGVTLGQSVLGIKLKGNLGLAMWQRLKAFIIIPSYVAIGLQGIFFCFHKDVSWIFVSKLITKASWATVLTQCIVYNAIIHSALYIVQWYNCERKEKMRMYTTLRKN